MPLATETNNTIQSTLPSVEKTTLTGAAIEVIDERYIKLLEENAYGYKGSATVEDKKENNNVVKGQISMMREFIHTLQERQLLLKYNNGRFEIDTSSLPLSVLPENMKTRLSDVMNIIYGKENPIGTEQAGINPLDLRDTTGQYNANEERITSHIEQASVEVLTYSNPDKHTLADTFSILDLEGDIRSGKKPLKIEDIKKAIMNKPEQSIQEKQFLKAYDAVLAQGQKTFTADQKKEKEIYDKDIQEKRLLLDKSLKQVQEQLSITKETEKTTVGLFKEVSKSLGITMGNMATVNKNPLDWSMDDAKKAGWNILSGTGQVANNVGWNMTHNLGMAFDTPAKIYTALIGFFSFLIPDSWGIKKYLKYGALLNIFSNYASGGKNIWELGGEAAKKASEYTMQEDPNNPLTEDQKNTIAKMPVGDIWLQALDLPEDEAKILATITNIPISGFLTKVANNDKKGDIIFTNDVFTEAEQEILKKKPNFNAEKGFRTMLKGIYGQHSLKIQSLFPQYPVGTGTGQYTEEYLVMKYLKYRYGHNFRKGPEVQVSKLNEYDNSTFLKKILEYEMDEFTSTDKQPTKEKKAIELEFEAKFPKPTVEEAAAL